MSIRRSAVFYMRRMSTYFMNTGLQLRIIMIIYGTGGIDLVDFLEKELELLKESRLYRQLPGPLEKPAGPRTSINGQEVALFSSNNYLGLAHHPRVKAAAVEAVERWGTGSGGSRLTTGNFVLHRQLEERIARFKGTEDAVVFSSGYLANLGVISALVGRGDLVLSDELNHASIIDGCRLSRATVKVFRHRCLAKGITGGYLPLAATLDTDEIYEAFLGEPEECKTFYHGHTYTGNPLACAAALASIELFEKTDLLASLQPKIDLLRRGLENFRDLPHVGDIRQRGMMVGIELVVDKDTKEPYAIKEQIGHRVILEARRRGLILRPLGNVIVLMPVLSMSNEELNRVLEITYESIAVVTGK